jgi:hypothetical protein
MFLFYIATGIASLIVFNQVTRGAEGSAAMLASIAQHALLMRVTVLLTLVEFVDAVVLAVALYALTRDQDADLAVLALCCRASEGVITAISGVRMLGLLSIATASTAAGGADLAASLALGGLLLKAGGLFTLISATCFALGSTVYSYLFLRARSIPVALAWLGVVASVLLLAALPAQLAGFVKGSTTQYVWIPMALFEVTLGLWLLIKGVRPPATR